ncbi:hypothetical protein C8J55DRAFT_562168 [Lentinula edodes]|uniref:Uncharacterized protein n=1 Tax=Lentinula lateritia TaxID=40482 RepID=A0A9W9DKQ6_9AGAR|nr:hypothetical protein C8J55DRAFT_562168 [Lentinula edodes]
MTRDHGRQDIKAEMSIEWLEELETSIGNIEAKAGIPKPSLYKDSVKKLASMLRNILVHIIIYEHDAAPESRRGEMLVHLGDRLKQFDQTATKCERFVDMLSGRSLAAAIILRGFDMKMINVLHEEIKMREQDLERGITRLKIRWNTYLQPRQNLLSDREQAESQLEQRSGTTSWNSLSPRTRPAFATQSSPSRNTTIQPSPPPSPAPITISSTTPTNMTITPTATLSHALVDDSSFNNAGNDMHNTTINDHSRWTGTTNIYGMTVVHNHFRNE